MTTNKRQSAAKEVYRETYHKGSMMMPQNKLPDLPWLENGYRVDTCELRAAGRLDDGREFQELRVVVRERV